MSKFLNAAYIKEQVSIVDLLSNLGYRPLRKSGKELIYLSMLRDSDTVPSFSVDDKLGVWYDHGAGRGGNIIDFGLAYWPVLSFRGVLKKIVEVSNATINTTEDGAERYSKRRHAQRVPHYHVEEIKELGNNDVITEYLQSRGILDAALGSLNEVYYYVEDEMKFRKYFFAAGWKNESGGWEVRNKYFKGCLGFKGTTFIPGDKACMAVFEDHLNYLSWLTLNPQATEAVLVLNSLSLLKAGTKKGKEYQRIDLFFANNEKGQEATKAFVEEIPGSNNMSHIYEGYNNLNDWLTGIPETPLIIEEHLSLPDQSLSAIKR